MHAGVQVLLPVPQGAPPTLQTTIGSIAWTLRLQITSSALGGNVRTRLRLTINVASLRMSALGYDNTQNTWDHARWC